MKLKRSTWDIFAILAVICAVFLLSALGATVHPVVRYGIYASVICVIAVSIWLELRYWWGFFKRKVNE
jgi:hypothetical protein